MRKAVTSYPSGRHESLELDVTADVMPARPAAHRPEGAPVQPQGLLAQVRH